MKITYHVTSQVGVTVFYVWPGETPVESWHYMDFQGISYEVTPDGSLIVHKLDYYARFPPKSLPNITITVKCESFPCTGADFVAQAGK